MKIKDLIKKVMTNNGEMDKVPYPYILVISIFEVAEIIGHDEGWRDINIFEYILFPPIFIVAFFLFQCLIWGIISELWRKRDENIIFGIILFILILCYKLGLIGLSLEE